MNITSPAFEHEGTIPSKYSCEGDNVSPPLTISDIPEGTVSLALIAHDADVPKVLQEEKGAPAEWTHWTMFNMNPETTTIEEGAMLGTPGNNTSGKPAYEGPCPPKEYEPTKHRYYFTIYALDTTLTLESGTTREAVEKAMEEHTLAKAQLLGHYEKE